MSVKDQPRDKSLLDQARDAIDDFFGGNAEEAAEQTPEAVADRMHMDQQQLRDVGMGTRGVENPPYSGSAGSQALGLAEEDTPGSELDPPDSALAPF